MKLVEVKLTINRVATIFATLEKVVEVEKLSTPIKTRRLAELKYCNDYINRDGKVATFSNLTETKGFARLRIKSSIV